MNELVIKMFDNKISMNLLGKMGFISLYNSFIAFFVTNRFFLDSVRFIKIIRNGIE